VLPVYSTEEAIPGANNLKRRKEGQSESDSYKNIDASTEKMTDSITLKVTDFDSKIIGPPQRNSEEDERAVLVTSHVVYDPEGYRRLSHTFRHEC